MDGAADSKSDRINDPEPHHNYSTSNKMDNVAKSNSDLVDDPELQDNHPTSSQMDNEAKSNSDLVDDPELQDNHPTSSQMDNEAKSNSDLVDDPELQDNHSTSSQMDNEAKSNSDLVDDPELHNSHSVSNEASESDLVDDPELHNNHSVSNEASESEDVADSESDFVHDPPSSEGNPTSYETGKPKDDNGSFKTNDDADSESDFVTNPESNDDHLTTQDVPELKDDYALAEINGDSKSKPGAADDGEDEGNWHYENVLIKDGIEDISNYRPGGFAPLILGDMLHNDRFQIVQKLGHGGIAIVWLCWDFQAHKWCAVKVNSAAYSSPDCNDLKALQLMEKNYVTREELEANHIIMAADTFWMESPNGKHLCTVLPVLGPRVHDWRGEVLGLDSERVKKICYQITEGLDFLHSHGLCHGDLRPQNVLMKLKPGSIDHLGHKDMWALLGTPETTKVYTINGKKSKHAPEYVVTPAMWQRFRDFVADEAVIVDFGESYVLEDAPVHFGIPIRYAAPELLFQKGQPMLTGDIWALAITFLELRLDQFEIDAPLPAIRRMERFIGTIPIGYRYAAIRLLDNYGWEGEAYSRDEITGCFGPLTGPLDVPQSSDEERDFSGATYADILEMKLASEQRAWVEDPNRAGRNDKMVSYYLADDEVRDLADLLRSMLKYDPKDRISTSQVLRHRWFKKQRPFQCSVMRHWRYMLGVVFVLASLLYLYWTWNGYSCTCAMSNASGRSAFADLVESSAITIVFLTLQ